MTETTKHLRRPVRDGVWWAGLVVAAAAAAATAHGLYAVAAASHVPWPVAGLYPVMTDGLALVAYSATNRLTDGSRQYAWAVVVAAAGLSGAAQALYLAGGGLEDAPAAVRFGIGAAPALAAAAVAHLLHLIRTAAGSVEQPKADPPALGSDVQPGSVQPDEALNASTQAVQPASRPGTDRRTAPEALRPGPAAGGRPAASAGTPAGAADRARRAALAHRDQHGTLPTTSELVRLVGVSRGTAGTVLKGLRTTDNRPERNSRSGVDRPEPDQDRTASDEQPTHDQTKIQNDYTPMHHDPEGRRPPPAGTS